MRFRNFHQGNFLHPNRQPHTAQRDQGFCFHGSRIGIRREPLMRKPSKLHTLLGLSQKSPFPKQCSWLRGSKQPYVFLEAWLKLQYLHLACSYCIIFFPLQSNLWICSLTLHNWHFIVPWFGKASTQLYWISPFSWRTQVQNNFCWIEQRTPRRCTFHLFSKKLPLSLRQGKQQELKSSWAIYIYKNRIFKRFILGYKDWLQKI